MKSSTPVGFWFLGLAFIVFTMAVIGAITRLTESGLSIVDWQPVQDIFLPRSQADWQHAFQLYQTSPQYRYVNHGMTLGDYKQIYYWEWLHRMWGRVVLGLGFVVPFLVFLVTRHLDRHTLRLALMVAALIGLQGFLGWFMVESGLDRRPSVSHYRLAMHLGLALFLYGFLFWNGLKLLSPLNLMSRDPKDGIALRSHGEVTLLLVALTMVWGAFTAGLRAGLIYNTFPLMGGHLMPVEWDYYQPVWKNFVMNPATVQFTHRLLAFTTLVMLLGLVWRTWKARDLPKSAQDLAMAILVAGPLQVVLGALTVVHAVPVHLAALHQANAIVVLTLVLSYLFVLRRPRGGVVLTRVLDTPVMPRSETASPAPDMRNRNPPGLDR